VIATTMLSSLKPEVLEGYVTQIPVGRLGKPEDVANAVLFFACEESGYITGQTLPITGGWF
jgi:NAD(P)-dependent dehydrogenase (short-subunit alcohol dehydrogenase family)